MNEIPDSRTNLRMEELIRKIETVCPPEMPSHRSARAAHAPIRPYQVPRPALGVRCPQCNKRALRKAKRKTFFDHFSALVLFAPYRCRYCRYFEFRFAFDKPDSGPKPRRS